MYGSEVHTPKNLFAPLPHRISGEFLEVLVKTESFHLERIVSTGQATPPGEWYDQDTHEWVILLSGRAALLFDSEPEAVVMKPGDYMHIPAHRRHRVEWTDPEEPTVWLALHYK
jgi:cupin 2 domain-containing protein